MNYDKSRADNWNDAQRKISKNGNKVIQCNIVEEGCSIARDKLDGWNNREVSGMCSSECTMQDMKEYNSL